MEKLKNCKIESKKEFCVIPIMIQRIMKTAKVEQVWVPNSPFASKENVSSIAVDGPWPDYLEMYFRELGLKRLFKSSVEIFHSAGGELEKV